MTESRSLDVERSTSTGHRLAHYDGVCNNLHGHNMRWEVVVAVEMVEGDETNMPLDLKDVSSLIDLLDHVVILNAEDPLVEQLEIPEPQDDLDRAELVHRPNTPMGEMFLAGGDPTCEVLVEWMANRLLELDYVYHVEVTLHETDKYGVNHVDHDLALGDEE